jgi:DHA1 family tetracycline resistance protein-like MFS transporter
MICMTGLAGCYGLMWVSVELQFIWLFLAGRLASGLMAGTAPIAQAAMMDTAPSDQRPTAMAQVTLANTVGLVAGPPSAASSGTGISGFRSLSPCCSASAR